MDLRTAVCVSALFIQSITAQCYDRPSAQPPSFIKTLVGGDSPITITYTCPISPSGLRFSSELGMEGQLSVSGSMPFSSAVAMEGSLPATGRASASYGCGDTVFITQETGNPCGANANVASGLTLANLAKRRQ